MRRWASQRRVQSAILRLSRYAARPKYITLEEFTVSFIKFTEFAKFEMNRKLILVDLANSL
jgi:hypothetical protein